GRTMRQALLRWTWIRVLISGVAVLSLAAAVTVAVCALPARAHAEQLDFTPRTAVMSAYQPEWTLLRAALKDAREFTVNRTLFVTGTIEDKPVVLYLSGISMVNAAMTTQMALDHFDITRIVYSGIAGGSDPKLTLGDVVVPEAWSEYLESVFA